MRRAILIALAAVLVVAAALQNAAAAAQDDATGAEPAASPTPWVVATVALGGNPRGAAADVVNGRVYVGLSSAASGANVAVVSGATGAVLGTLGTQGTHPNGVAVNPLAPRLFVSNKLSNDLSLVDPNTGTATRTAVGSQPWGVAANVWRNRIYVANFGDNSVSILDATTGAVLSTTGSVPQPAFIAVDAANDRVYVTSNGHGLYILNAVTGGIEAGPINTSADSRGVAVHPTTGRAYIANHDTANPRLFVREPGGALSSINLPAPPMNVAVNPNTNHLFITLVTSGGEMSLLVLDAGTLQVVATVPIGPEDAGEGGQGLAIDTTLNRVFVTRYQAGQLVIVDDPGAPASPTPMPTLTPTRTRTRTATPTATRTATHTNTVTPVTPTEQATTLVTATVTATATATPTHTATAAAVKTASATPWPSPTGSISVVYTAMIGAAPKGLAVNSSNHHLYVAMIHEGLVTVLDGRTGGYVRSLASGGSGPNGVAVDEQTGMVYVTNKNSGDVAAIDPVTGFYRTAQTGHFPWGVAVDPARNRLYVANFGRSDEASTHTVAVFQASTLQAAATTLVGRSPALAAASPLNGYVYVTTYGADEGGYVLDSAGNVLDRLFTGSGSLGVAVSPSSGRIYVTNRLAQQLHIITPGGGRLSVALGAAGYGVAVNPTTGRVFVIVIAGGQASLQARDGVSGSLLASIPLGAEDENDGGQGIAVDAALSRVYAVSYQTGLLTAIADGAGPVQPTPSATATPSVSPTFVPTPGGGWPQRVSLPIIIGDWQMQDPPTATPTITPTPSRTATGTRSATATHTRTATLTRTVTRTPTRTVTAAVSPTATPTVISIDWQIPEFLHIAVSPASVPSGQAYWKLVRAVYQDDTQSGGNHGVYFRVEDEEQQSLMGINVCLGWPSGEDCSHVTEYHSNYPAGYAADIPMWASYDPAYGPGPYTAWAAGLPGDRVTGLGLPLNHHVNFMLTFRRTIAP